MFSTYLQFPINLPTSQIVNSHALIYLRLTSNDLATGSVFNNYAYDTTNGYQYIYITTSYWQYTEWEDTVIGQPGLLSSSTRLFDGISCQDKSYQLTMNSASSAIIENLGNMASWQNGASAVNQIVPLSGATVEFWAYLGGAGGSNPLVYLMSLYAHTTGQTYFEILNYQSAGLICAPFGLPYVGASEIAYTQLSINSSGAVVTP